jgi:hypothetical protein
MIGSPGYAHNSPQHALQYPAPLTNVGKLGLCLQNKQKIIFDATILGGPFIA